MSYNNDTILMSIGALSLFGVAVYVYSRDGEESEEDDQRRRLRERVERELRDVQRRREERVKRETEEIAKLRRRMEKEEQERRAQERRLQERRLRDSREKYTRQYYRREVEFKRRFEELELLEKLEKYTKILKEGGKLSDEQQAFVDKMDFYISEWEWVDDIDSIDERELEYYLRNRERYRLKSEYLTRLRTESGMSPWSRLGTIWRDLGGDVLVDKISTLKGLMGKRDNRIL